MIITLTKANFSSCKIGTLTTWNIRRSLGSGATSSSSATTVNRNASWTETITLADGYTFGTCSITMGSTTITPTVTGNTLSFTISAVTGNINITVATINESTGEEDGGDTGGDTPSVPSAGTLFDFDFTTNTIEDYVTSGVITLPTKSKTDNLTYSNKGLSTSSTELPAALSNGVKLSNAFELSSQSWTFEVTMTMDAYDSESMGTSVTEALYPNLMFFSSAEHDALADGKSHDSNCLSPAIYINSGKFSGRFPDQGSVTIGSSSKLFIDDGLEHTYKWVYDKSTNTNTIYVDNVNKWSAAWSRTDYNFGGSMQYLLGVHYGYSSAKNFCIKKGMHIKNMKMYTN